MNIIVDFGNDLYNESITLALSGVDVKYTFRKREVRHIMANIDLSQYGITGTTEIVYNPSYELLLKKRQIQVLKALKKDRKANWELLM